MTDKNSDKSASFIVRLKADNRPKSVLGGQLFHAFKILCEKSFVYARHVALENLIFDLLTSEWQHELRMPHG